MNRGLNKYANMLFQGMDLLLGHLSQFNLSTMSRNEMDLSNCCILVSLFQHKEL